ncbi:uncharacterized protein KNAG_0E02040 [Huiozyma naganishii CBS 8797]|uniref:Uncharacterized protein n=1 Tax=Huiozyma naganishii (strain ATCC MYA-139 / BCRC 22969 / CBS 8797 / KCTC 17520 / NBRC 10181 / NCYC 3082 / Yp74L-3) TaxID=1071383 RepID=J7S7S8_HUIN7|nr:hypothetical protein KNAG_0E02040 [Kazachstania naganishii CBS 8797]CCK70466.1 hypothetical protein KNAG_0E02040 [Kazachstania naganishii CBS 8797]
MAKKNPESPYKAIAESISARDPLSYPGSTDRGNNTREKTGKTGKITPRPVHPRPHTMGVRPLTPFSPSPLPLSAQHGAINRFLQRARERARTRLHNLLHPCVPRCRPLHREGRGREECFCSCNVGRVGDPHFPMPFQREERRVVCSAQFHSAVSENIRGF